MTDLNRHSEDELVSAVLDGEATAEEVARVEADPRLRHRLEDFRRIAAAVAAPSPATSDAQRDALLATALAAASVSEPEVEAETPGAVVIPLERSRRIAPNYLIGIAAAAVVLLLLAVPLALRDGGQGGRDTQTAAVTNTLVDDEAERTGNLETDETALPPADTAAVGDSADISPDDPLLSGDGDAAPQTSLPAEGAITGPLPEPGASEVALVPLGDFDSRDEATIVVTQAVLDARDADRLAPAFGLPTDLRATPCLEGVLSADGELDTLTWAGTLDLPDGEHQLLLFRLLPSLGANGDYRLYEVLTADCTVISEDTLD